MFGATTFPNTHLRIYIQTRYGTQQGEAGNAIVDTKKQTAPAIFSACNGPAGVILLS